MALGFQKRDRTTPIAVSIPSSATTTVTSYTVATDEQVFLVGYVMFATASSGHMTNGGFLTCQAVVKNDNGTLSFVAAIGSSNNPATSTNLAAAGAEAVDTALLNTGTLSITFAISGTSVNLNATSSGITACDAIGYIDIPLVAGYA